jgi:hypothetical protein
MVYRREASMSIRMGRSEKAFFRIACALTVATVLVSSWSQDAAEVFKERKVPCKTPENAAVCYWAHGRLSAYNGTPTFRLWKIGSHRILGIYSGPDAEKLDELDNEHPQFPSSVSRVLKPFSNQIFADFEICPLEPEVAGSMQAACIESAKNIVAK